MGHGEGELATTARVAAVLVTFRRPEALRGSLDAILAQTRPPDVMVCVDNAPSDRARHEVEARPTCRYVAAPENLGPAGGYALGMEHLLDELDDRDWIVLFDDDDPVDDSDVLERVLGRAEALRRADPKVGGVGLFGSRYHPERGNTRRVPVEELHSEVDVDWLANTMVPLWSVACVRDVGPYDARLFFGLEELEFGLRARRAGWRVVMLADLLRERRERRGPAAPREATAAPPWRRYYSHRNAIVVASRHGTRAVRWRVAGARWRRSVGAFVRRGSLRVVVLEWRGIVHGLRGVGGRVVEPDPSTGERSRRSRRSAT